MREQTGDAVKRVMIDFETLGNGKNACVVQVGACYFGRDEIGRIFKATIDAEDAVKHGGEFDASTVYWWLGQSEEARQSILAADRRPIKPAFEALNDFLADAEEIWSHATFDFVILMETLKMLGMKPKFGYRTARDIRTLKALAKPTPELVREGVHHDGLADAIYQAKYTSAMLVTLGVL